MTRFSVCEIDPNTWSLFVAIADPGLYWGCGEGSYMFIGVEPPRDMEHPLPNKEGPGPSPGEIDER